MKFVLLINEEERDLPSRVHDAVPGHTVASAADPATAKREIADADAFYGQITPDLLASARRLRWIQSPVIGLERTMFDDLARHPAVLTNPRGIFSDDIADHVLGFTLMFARGLHHYARAQARHDWSARDRVGVIHLPDATIGIVGLGGIGEAVAARAHAHGMRVLAIDARRTAKPASVERLDPPSGLAAMLNESHFIVICAPETPETRGLFDRRVFSAMRRDGYLINIGRGQIVRLDALVAALRSGQIAGAALDVFETEPLPADHPLWDMENVIITPHVAGHGPHTAARRHAVLLDNARRFVAGEPLVNVVDKSRWF